MVLIFATSLFAASLMLAQALTPEVIEHAQAGAAALQQHRLDEAIHEFQQVVEMQPKSASGYANLGDAYFEKGDYSNAIPQLKHALDLNPKLMGAQQALGVALLVQGDPETALPHLEQTRNPALLGLAYLETGRLGSAVVALDAALRQQPGDPDLLYYFGRANKLAAERTARTLEHTGPANRIDSNVQIPQDLLELEAQLGKDPENPALLAAFDGAAENASKQAFEAVLHQAPDSARAHQIAAERDLAAGHLREAQTEYEEAVKLRPYTSGVHIALGSVLLAEGNQSAALLQFAAEAALQPASADVAYRNGIVLLDCGRAQAALDELTRAGRLKPDTPEILAATAKAALAANDPARAEKELLALLAVVKEGDLAAAAHAQLEAIYRQEGRTADAESQEAAYNQAKRSEGGEHGPK